MVVQLIGWLRDHAGIPVDAIEPLGAPGRSNVHHRVRAGGTTYVLRHPPATGRLPTAHDVAREHAVLDVLWRQGVPVPRPVLLWTDPNVLGVPFLLMTECPGTVAKDGWGPLRRPDVRSAACADLVAALARVHAVDWRDTPLRAFDRPEPHATRQLRRLTRQWTHAGGDDPLADQVHRALTTRFTTPPTRPTTVVHGDYGPHNAVLSPDGRVTAVLDWELWTVGDPLADLAWLLALWPEPGDPPERRALLGPLSRTAAEGTWTRARLAERYHHHTGTDLTDLPRYLALSFYKLAVIQTGIAHRLATSPEAPEIRHRARLSLRAALTHLDGTSTTPA